MISSMLFLIDGDGIKPICRKLAHHFLQMVALRVI